MEKAELMEAISGALHGLYIHRGGIHYSGTPAGPGSVLGSLGSGYTREGPGYALGTS